MTSAEHCKNKLLLPCYPENHTCRIAKFNLCYKCILCLTGLFFMQNGNFLWFTAGISILKLVQTYTWCKLKPLLKKK